jgi:hypothetical protein
LDHVDEFNHERAYHGTLTLDGYYYLDESGEGLMFAPKSKFVHAVPEMGRAGESFGFEDAEATLKMMRLEKATKKIDAQKYCMYGGEARITIKSIVVGDGPSRWYTAALDRLHTRSEPRLYRCGDQANIDKFNACATPLPGNEPVCDGVISPH